MSSLDLNEIIYNFKDMANELLEDDTQLNNLIYEAKDKIDELEILDRFIDDIYVSLDLLDDWRHGRYDNVSKESIIMIIACLIYIVNPMDIVPDILKSLGIVGDLAAFIYIFKVLNEELEKYKDWRSSIAPIKELEAGDKEEIREREDEFIDLPKQSIELDLNKNKDKKEVED